MQVSGSRVSSSAASKKTLLRRTHKLSHAREFISGGDSSAQMQSEMRCLTRQEREELLQDAHLPIVIPTDHALAMKADLALSWGKVEVISR